MYYNNKRKNMKWRSIGQFVVNMVRRSVCCSCDMAVNSLLIQNDGSPQDQLMRFQFPFAFLYLLHFGLCRLSYVTVTDGSTTVRSLRGLRKFLFILCSMS